MTKSLVWSRYLYWAQPVFLLFLFFAGLAFCFALSIGVDFASGKFAFNLTAYSELFKNTRSGNAFLNSLRLAGATAIIVLPIAIGMAKLVISIASVTTRSFFLGILLLPLLSSSMLRMFGYAKLLSESGWIGWFYGLFGDNKTTGILFTETAALTGLVSNVLPVCILICFVQLLRVETAQVMAARNLGASAWQIFWCVELPQCRGAMIVSAQVCLLFTVADVFSQSILGGNRVYTYASALSDRIKINDWPAASAMALVLVFWVCAILVTITLLAARRKEVIPHSRKVL